MDEQAKKDALYEFVKKFIEDEEIHCPEAVYQRDSLVVVATDFMADACGIVGFVELDELDE